MLYKQSRPQIPLLNILVEKLLISYPPSVPLKATANILKIGKKTKVETKIIMLPILPTIKLSPFNHPREDNPCVI